MQHCPNCGAGELKIIAVILERPVIEKILTHLGLDPQPPPRGRPREAAVENTTPRGLQRQTAAGAALRPGQRGAAEVRVNPSSVGASAPL